MAMVSGTSQASLSRLGCILKVRNLKGKKWKWKGGQTEDLLRCSNFGRLFWIWEHLSKGLRGFMLGDWM